MRLIDADAMEQTMCDLVNGDIRHYPYSDTEWDMAYKWIDHQPTIDVTPVVRCKDCKYNNACFTQSFVESEGVLPFDRSTWYCADAERKDDEVE